MASPEETADAYAQNYLIFFPVQFPEFIYPVEEYTLSYIAS